MTTSGTIGTTTVSTAKILEKAIRRCGLLPQTLTPETAAFAQEDLYMLLLSMTNRGLNLWCIDQKLLPLNSGQSTYVLPVGTLSVLNLLQATPTVPDYALTAGALTLTAESVDDISVVRWGVVFAVNPTTSFTLQTSTDGVTWTALSTVAATELQVEGLYNWFDLPVKTTARWFRLSGLTGATTLNLLLSTGNREIVITPFNRDDYANQPNKNQQSAVATNYYFEKLINPRITLWPVPSSVDNHLALFRYRQIQDVGTLTQELELPKRWLEAISWHLALRLAFEVPSVDPNRRAEVRAMAAEMVIETERGESDDAPVRMAPAISCYTA